MKSKRHRAPRASTTKCVRIVGQGVPIRLSNTDAFQIVHRDHDGEYCTKKFYRDWYGANGEPRARCRINEHGRVVSCG